MSDGEFSVVQFFHDGFHEYVTRFVDIETALGVAKRYTSNVAAEVGITRRVIITDGGDCTVFEWKAGEGVTWPQGSS